MRRKEGPAAPSCSAKERNRTCSRSTTEESSSKGDQFSTTRGLELLSNRYGRGGKQTISCGPFSSWGSNMSKSTVAAQRVGKETGRQQDKEKRAVSRFFGLWKRGLRDPEKVMGQKEKNVSRARTLRRRRSPGGRVGLWLGKGRGGGLLCVSCRALAGDRSPLSSTGEKPLY